jgi:hypothetical protein
MVATSKIILPYEPGYVANKEADKRRKETKERLRQREREFAERQQPPLIVPQRLRAALSWRLHHCRSFKICSYCSSISLSFPRPLTFKSAEICRRP